MNRSHKREPGYRNQSESLHPSGRPSRRLHHSATTAPPSMVQVTVIAQWSKTSSPAHAPYLHPCRQAPRRALTRHPWPPSVCMVALFTNSASCLVSGATPAKHRQVLRSCLCQRTESPMKVGSTVLAWVCGAYCPLADHPYASPQGEVGQGQVT